MNALIEYDTTINDCETTLSTIPANCTANPNCETPVQESMAAVLKCVETSRLVGLVHQNESLFNVNMIPTPKRFSRVAGPVVTTAGSRERPDESHSAHDCLLTVVTQM